MSTNQQPHGIEALTASILNESIVELRGMGFEVSMPPVPVAEICYLRGLSVNPEVNLCYENSKLAGMLDAPKRAVYYEATDILGRQHFSIAHELGHYEIHWLKLLQKHHHDDINGQFMDLEEMFTRYFRGDELTPLQSGLLFRAEGKKRIIRDPRIEAEANYFAQYIMMPEDLVKQSAIKLEGLPFLTAKRVLAHQFEVSEMAMDLRLKQLGLHGQFEYQHQRKFFLGLGQENGSKSIKATQEDGADRTITIFPQSRLRTLITEVERLTKSKNRVLLDFQPFDGADLDLFGVRQALELALLYDYITFSSDEATLSVYHRFPANAEYIIRHIGRMGLATYIGLENNSGQYFADPQAVITGNHVLLKLTRINNGTDLAEMSSKFNERILEWLPNIITPDAFADLAAKVLLKLGQDLTQLRSDPSGYDFGYVGVELQRIITAGEIVGYRLIIAVGDIGISLADRLRAYSQVESASDFDAVETYCFDDTERNSLIQEITQHEGYLQINSGDVQYHIGRGSTNFFTGLSKVPGLQITAVLSAFLEQGK